MTTQATLFTYEPELFDNVPPPKRTIRSRCVYCSRTYYTIEAPRYLLCDGCAQQPSQAIVQIGEQRSCALSRVANSQRRASYERTCATDQEERERINAVFNAVILAEHELILWLNRCESELRKVK